MNQQTSRTLTSIAGLAFALALGVSGRAWAQEDDDDLDKIPAPESHHVIRPRAEAPSDEEAPPARAQPAPAPRPAPPPPEPAPARRAAEPVEAPPAHGSRAQREKAKKSKRDKRHKKLSRKHGKGRHDREATEDEEAPAPPPAETPARSRPRVIEASPRAPSDDEDEPTATVHKAAAAEPGEGEARQPADSSGGDMDFNLLPQSKTSSAEAATIESKVHTRRTMLQVHQGFGIATAVLMAATVITGQLNYSDRFGGGGGSGQYEIWHDTFEAATVLSFTTAGLLAVLAPTPFEHKSSGVDTVTIHKYSMLVSTIGMAAEIPLGIWTVSREGYVNQGTLALTHLVIGYVTAAALTAGATALFF